MFGTFGRFKRRGISQRQCCVNHPEHYDDVIQRIHVHLREDEDDSSDYLYPCITSTCVIIQHAQDSTPDVCNLARSNYPQGYMERNHIQRDEEPEPKVIPLADASLQEEAMMIVGGHAMVADVAVMRP